MAEPAASPRRFRFRFSLRTLVLFVAVCGSGIALWAHWEPWRTESEFEIGDWPPDWKSESFLLAVWPDAFFTADGERLIVTSHGVGNVQIWDWRHNKLLRQYKVLGIMRNSLQTHRHYMLAWKFVEKHGEGKQKDFAIIDTATLQEVPSSEIKISKPGSDDGFTLPQWIDRLSSEEWFCSAPTHDKSRILRVRSDAYWLHDYVTSRLYAQLERPPPVDFTIKPPSNYRKELLSAAVTPQGNRIAVASADMHSIRIYRRHRPEFWWGVAWLPEFWLTLALTLALLWSVRRDWKGLGAG